MTAAIDRWRAGGRARRIALFWLGASAVFVLIWSICACAFGLRINLTPSQPMGIWQIERLARQPEVGDRVFVCPPLTGVMCVARERGYLRPGLCPGGTAPLIKIVAAISGQRVEVGSSVRIDGQLLGRSEVLRTDGQGRLMMRYGGGVVAPEAVYLHSDYPGSFDSRYFGPLSIHEIIGLAGEMWTFGR